MATTYSPAEIVKILESQKEKITALHLETLTESYNTNKDKYVYIDLDSCELYVYEQEHNIEDLNCIKIYEIEPRNNLSRFREGYGSYYLRKLIEEYKEQIKPARKSRSKSKKGEW